jgi:hypothetical protein
VGLSPTGKAPPYHGAHPKETLIPNSGETARVSKPAIEMSVILISDCLFKNVSML